MRCSNCYEWGHNKRGCPKRKERVRKLIAAGDTNNWRVREQQRYDQVKKTRACSYCRKPGHTRRTCSEFKGHKHKFAAINSVYRQKLLDSMKELGLGTGALLTKQISYYDDGERKYTDLLFMVKSVNWDVLHWTDLTDRYNNTRLFELVSVGKHPTSANGTTEYVSMPPIEGVYPEMYGWEHSGYTVTASVTEAAVEACVPGGFLQGYSGLEDIFDKELNHYTAQNWFDHHVKHIRDEGFDYLPEP